MERLKSFDPMRWVHTGIILYAAAVFAFGVLVFVTGKPVQGLEPLPVWLPGHLLWIYLSGALLLGAGLGILLPKMRRWEAYILGFLLLVWIIALHVPLLVASPRNGGEWTGACEVLGISGAAWILAYRPRATGSTPGGSAAARIAALPWIGRLCYGVSLPAFGVLHIVYAAYVASVIPAWIPGHLFWTYFVAVVFFAAGAGIISGILARRAAFWTGIMFFSWVLMVHLPRVINPPAVFGPANPRAEWTSMLVALAMGGAAWVVAHSLTPLAASSARDEAA